MNAKRKCLATLGLGVLFLLISSCGISTRGPLSPAAGVLTSPPIVVQSQTPPASSSAPLTATEAPVAPETTGAVLSTNDGPGEEPLITVAGQIVIRVTSAGFAPNLIYGPVGTVVVWQNAEPFFQGCCPHCHVKHSVASEDGSLNGPLSIRDVYARYFGSPGTYRYFDRDHPELMGTIVIEGGRSIIESKTVVPDEAGLPLYGNQPGKGALEGTVQLPDGVTASSVSIWLFPFYERGAAFASGSVLPDGRYRIGSIPPGSYVVYVTVTGSGLPEYFAPSYKEILITPGGVTTMGPIHIAV